MNGYDWDGTLCPQRVTPEPPYVIISGRTDQEPLIVVPDDWPAPFLVVWRGKGAVGDRNAAALFKADAIVSLGVTRFYEDDPGQAEIIATLCPGVGVDLVK